MRRTIITFQTELMCGPENIRVKTILQELTEINKRALVMDGECVQIYSTVVADEVDVDSILANHGIKIGEEGENEPSSNND